jgi:DNA-directed RNA polymerase specialized sigma24 family protein
MRVVQDALVTAGRRLEQLYRDEGARLWRALVAFTGNREMASDAVAEAFAQAIGARATFAIRSVGSGEQRFGSLPES